MKTCPSGVELKPTLVYTRSLRQNTLAVHAALPTIDAGFQACTLPIISHHFLQQRLASWCPNAEHCPLLCKSDSHVPEILLQLSLTQVSAMLTWGHRIQAFNVHVGPGHSISSCAQHQVSSCRVPACLRTCNSSWVQPVLLQMGLCVSPCLLSNICNMEKSMLSLLVGVQAAYFIFM